MYKFMYFVISVALLAAYIADSHLLPNAVKFLPDLASALLVVYVLAEGSRQRFRYIAPKYWFLFGALALDVICGILTAGEDVGPIINGIRWYLRAIPLFFIPGVYNFSEKQTWNLLRYLLVLSFLQIPIAAYQRFSNEAMGITTGDVVEGTLMDSGILTLFLIPVLSILSALMLRRRIGRVWYAVCFFALLLPMSINETKVTVFLLPIALLSVFMLGAAPGRRLRVAFTAVGALIAAGAVFVPIYDFYNKDVPGQFSIEDFFTDPNAFNQYMTKDAGVGTGKEAGRYDSMAAPFGAFRNDPVKLIFGVGIGNASKSSLGGQFSGRYRVLFYNYIETMSFAGFLFELGVFGTGFILLLHYAVFADALALKKADAGLPSDIALGYIGAWTTITLGMFYTALHTFEGVSFMFWFFSGYVASQRLRVAARKPEELAGAAPLSDVRKRVAGTTRAAVRSQ